MQYKLKYRIIGSIFYFWILPFLIILPINIEKLLYRVSKLSSRHGHKLVINGFFGEVRDPSNFIKFFPPVNTRICRSDVWKFDIKLFQYVHFRRFFLLFLKKPVLFFLVARRSIKCELKRHLALDQFPRLVLFPGQGRFNVLVVCDWR